MFTLNPIRKIAKRHADFALDACGLLADAEDERDPSVRMLLLTEAQARASLALYLQAQQTAGRR